MILSDSIYDEVLLNPLRRNMTELKIISGYASANMVTSHYEKIEELGFELPKIKLFVGMSKKDGISIGDYQGFIAHKEFYDSGIFECSYIYDSPSVHSKLYIWSDESGNSEAYMGSANYTQNAFVRNGNDEIMTMCNPDIALNYFQSLERRTIFCDHPEVETTFQIYDRRYYLENLIQNNDEVQNVDDFTITLSLLNSRTHEIPDKSGLNWGQRDGRNRNQAYIAVPVNVNRNDFFPEIGEHFTVITDDDKTLIMVRAQANGKALHTPQNNALLGEYFRQRLGLNTGEKVETQHLLDYGRTDVNFTKLEEDTYFMDFSIE